MTKKTAVILVTALLVLFASVGVALAVFMRSGDPVVPSSDVITVARGDVEKTVPVEGVVSSQNVVNLHTSLTGPISTLDVEVGSRVNPGQLLAVIDTTAERRQLEAAQAEQHATQVTAGLEASRAQMAFDHYRQALAEGKNPEVNAAQAGVTDAAGAVDAARATVEKMERQLENPDSPELTAQRQALKTAAERVNSTQFRYGRAAIIESLHILVGAEPTNPGEADALKVELETAEQELENAQAAYDAALRQVDVELADAQMALNQAEQSRRNAIAALNTAELSATQQLETNRQAWDQAVAAAEAQAAPAQVTTSQLTQTINESEIRAPRGGVITVINAQVGAPASGPILTIADDTALAIDLNVRENEVSKIKPGNKVVFTTPASGPKECVGVVDSISPVGGKSGDSDSASQGVARVTFPVKVKVNPDCSGVSIGSTAKSRIVVSSAASAITVPFEAILTKDDGKKAVLVLNDDNVVEERLVNTGVESEFDVEITKDALKEGERVLSPANSHRMHVGRTVQVI